MFYGMIVLNTAVNMCLKYNKIGIYIWVLVFHFVDIFGLQVILIDLS